MARPVVNGTTAMPDHAVALRRWYRRTLYGGTAVLTLVILGSVALSVGNRVASYLDDKRHDFSIERALIESQIVGIESRISQSLARHQHAHVAGAVTSPPATVEHAHRPGIGIANAEPSPLEIVSELSPESPDFQSLYELAQNFSPDIAALTLLGGKFQQTMLYDRKRQFLAVWNPLAVSRESLPSGPPDRRIRLATTPFAGATVVARQGQAMVPSIKWLGPHIDTSSGNLVVSCLAPIFQDRAPPAVLVISIPLRVFASRFLPQALDEHYALHTFAGAHLAGAPLTRGDAAAIERARQTWRHDAVSRGAARAALYRVGGRFVLLQALSGPDWILTHSFGWLSIVRQLHHELLLIALLTAGVCVLLWSFAVLLDRRVFRPIHLEAVRVAQSEQFNRIMVATAPVGFCVLDIDRGSVILGNRLAQDYAALPGESVTLAERLLEAYRTHRSDAWPTADDKIVHSEISTTRDDGTPLHLLVSMGRARYQHKDVLLCGIHDISARKLSEDLLRQAKQEADEASQAKSIFLASTSHELRTPLHGALGNLELLETATMPPAQRALVTTIRASFESLLRVVNDILDLSKIEARRLHLQPAPFSPADLIECVTRTFAPLLTKKQVDLLCLIPALPPMLIGDAGRVRQILNNLLSNAAKFTPRGRVILRAQWQPEEHVGGRLRLLVADTGIGIAKHDQEKLFAPFAQANRRITNRYGGTGLGLALCRQLCDLMNGAIALRSGPGHGTQITVELPFAVDTHASTSITAPLAGKRILLICDIAAWRCDLLAQLRAWGAEAKPTLVRQLQWHAPYDAIVYAQGMRDDSPDELPAIVASTRIWLSQRGPLAPEPRGPWIALSAFNRSALCEVLSGLSAPPDARPSAWLSLSPPRLKILVADDDEISRRLIARQLNALGYTAVDCAENGRIALERSLANRYDVLFTDLAMPEIDGSELVRALRARGERFPVVALSATAINQDHPFRNAVDAVLVKPVLLEQLARTLTLVARPDPCRAVDMMHREFHSPVAGTALDDDLRAIFLRTCEQDIAGLERARQHNDKNAFLRRLHKIKGALLMLGENALVEALGVLQARVDAGGLARASDLHADFLMRVAALAQRYRDDLSQAKRQT